MPGTRSVRTRWIASVGAVVTAAALLAGAHTAGAAPVPGTGPGAGETHVVEYFDGPGGTPRHTTVPAEAPAPIARHRTSGAAPGERPSRPCSGPGRSPGGSTS
ncbi:hypothetical protein ACQ86F_33600 [Streptomyces venezuelae ATCC 10712]